MRPPTPPRPAGDGDGATAAGGTAGFTIVEFAVAMSIFMVIIAVTMSGIVMMTENTVKTTNLSTATDETRRAFSRLDRQVRYAEGVNRPVTSNGRYYVEFQALNEQGAATCYQWRLDPAARRLQWREWAASPVPATVTAPFTTAASEIANTGTPFAFTAASANRPFQVLDVTLVGRRASNTTATVTLRTSLTARNTSPASDSNPDTDGNGVTDVPVCTTSGGTVSRP